jgi:hypothetical protein
MSHRPPIRIGVACEQHRRDACATLSEPRGPDLRQRIIAGEDEDTIRASWLPAIQRFMKLRQKYLLYDDFTR